MSLSAGIHRLREVARRAGAKNPRALLPGLRALEDLAGAAGRVDLARLCGAAATAIATCRAGAVSANRLHAIRAHIERLTAYAEAGADVRAGETVPPKALVLPDDADDRQFLETLGMFALHATSTVAELEAHVLALETGVDPAEAVGCIRRIVHTLKAEFGVLNLAGAQQLCHETESAIDAVAEAGAPCPVDLLLEVADVLRHYLDRLAADALAVFADVTALLARLREVETGAAAGETDPSPASGRSAAAVVIAAGTARAGRAAEVDTARLDSLVDLAGELAIAQSMVLQDASFRDLDEGLARRIVAAGKITRDLQQAASSLRMVTVRGTFQKMARLVRHAAHETGRRVAFVTEGEDTELDRAVVDQVADPLVHLVRNAVVHGIEPGDERRAAGKSEEGRLLLRARHQGAAVVLEIRDDGRGIDKHKVVAKAIARGVLPPGADANAMADAEALDLIFLPGLSTADAVTDLSGRGVGLDVVRRGIEALRGRIEVESGPGAGTTFRLRLPLTLATIDGMVVRVGSERYVVPTHVVEHSFRPAPGDIHELDGGEGAHVRGELLPIHRLKHVMGLASGVDDLRRGILVVVADDGRRSCLFVDEIVGQQQVVIKALGGRGAGVPGIAGGTILGDGRVVLILDVAALVEQVVAA